MSAEASGAEGLPRWLAIVIVVLALFAIITGARDGYRRPIVAPPAERLDSASVRANGFMGDSLRPGRPSAVSSPAPVRKRAPGSSPKPAPGDSLVTRDTLPARYSPRGCMPE